jgi:hypothetical protein
MPPRRATPRCAKCHSGALDSPRLGRARNARGRAQRLQVPPRRSRAIDLSLLQLHGVVSDWRLLMDTLHTVEKGSVTAVRAASRWATPLLVLVVATAGCAGLVGYEYVVEERTVLPISAGASFTVVNATCPPGTKVLGGGFQIRSREVFVSQSFPQYFTDASGNSLSWWQVGSETPAHWLRPSHPSQPVLSRQRAGPRPGPRLNPTRPAHCRGSSRPSRASSTSSPSNSGPLTSRARPPAPPAAISTNR